MAEDALTHRRVLNIAIPIFISNATIPILGAVDTGVVGQMGQAVPIGAVGIGAMILTAIYWVFGFLKMGTVGLTAQAKGEGASEEVDALFSRVLLIGLVAGLCIIAAQSLLFRGAFWLAPASAQVEALASDYMAIRVWSAPATIALFGLTGWLIALERTKAVLALQLGMNGLNIVFDLLFVLHFEWGVAGVAWATFIAEWSGLILGLWLCRRTFLGEAWRDLARILDLARLKTMAVVNADILIRSVLVQTTFVSFLFYSARFGDVSLAANQILLQFIYIASNALDGFAAAAESLVGQAFGARQRARVRQAVKLVFLWGLIVSIIVALIFAVFGASFVEIMTTSAEVRADAGKFLIFAVAAPVVALAAWLLDGIFIGATRTADMRNMMIVTAVLYFISVYPLMALFGNHGLWLALLFSLALRGVTLAFRYPALERVASD